MDDIISRQAAKEAYCDHFCHRGVMCPDTGVCREVDEAFDSIPDAQPETHDKRTETHACDLISRQEAIDFIDAGHLCNPNEPRWSDNEVVNFLKSRPPAQTDLSSYSDKLWRSAYERGKKDASEERKTGKWTLLPNGNAICQECKHVQKSAWDVDGWDNFCHHCGADMRGEEE